jgi:hypothetical protein
MPATHRGTVASLQPEATTSISRETISHIETVTMKREDAQDRGNLRLLGEFKTVNDITTTLSNIEIRYLPGELAEVQYTYSGGTDNTQVNPGDLTGAVGIGGSSETWELDVKLRTVSLIRHPRYATVSDSDKRVLAAMIQFGLIDSEGNEIRRFLSNSGLANQCANLIELEGITSYEAAFYSLRRTQFNSSDVPLPRIGKISDPGAPAPPIAAGENWLVIGYRGKYAGNKWTELVTEWESSGGGLGWDNGLYS